jgi:hypothetical protein
MCRYPVGKLKESEQERPAEVSKRKEQVGQFFAKLAEMQDAEQFEIREFVVLRSLFENAADDAYFAVENG